MKRFLMPATALAAMKKMAFAMFCGAVLMIAAAPARAADICQGASPATIDLCDVTITIQGSTGNLSVKIVDNGTTYTGAELDDKLIGIQNLSSVAVGAIVLSGSDAFDLFADGDGACTVGQFSPSFTCGPSGYEGSNNTFVGISPDFSTGKVLFKTPLAALTGTAVFSLEGPPTAVVAVGENQKLIAGQASIFPFGPFALSGGVFTEASGTGHPDVFQIKPLNSASPDKLTVTLVPVPAGPLGLDTWGAGNFGAATPGSPGPGPLRFSAAAPFSNLACAPVADFSATSNPVCVEIELDCTSVVGGDSCNFLYTTQLDYAVDPLSLPDSIGVGGPAFLVQHDVDCPTSGFTQNIFLSYTGSLAGSDPPLKGSGTGGHSCYVSAFDPNAPAIQPGTTFSSFVGFQSPVSDGDENLYKAGSAIPLIWQYFSSPGVPITNLSLCTGTLATPVPTSSVCPGGAQPPWVFVGTVKANCLNDPTPNTATDTGATAPAGASNLQNFGNGTYQYNLKTAKPAPSACFQAVLIFDGGLTVFPANFKSK